MQKALLSLFVSMGLTDISIEKFQANDDPIEPGDIVLGEMNDLEKTCYAFLNKKEIEHKELHEKMETLEDDSEEMDELEYQHSLLKNRADIIKKHHVVIHRRKVRKSKRFIRMGNPCR